MKLFEGEVKGTGEMTDEELLAVVAMLRQMRASSLTQATRSIKQKAAKKATAEATGKKKATPGKVDLAKLTATLTPEMAAKLRELMAGS